MTGVRIKTTPRRIEESSQYWRDLIGRDWNVVEQNWLGEFKPIQANRRNWNSPGIPDKGQSCIFCVDGQRREVRDPADRQAHLMIIRQPVTG